MKYQYFIAVALVTSALTLMRFAASKPAKGLDMLPPPPIELLTVEETEQQHQERFLEYLERQEASRHRYQEEQSVSEPVIFDCHTEDYIHDDTNTKEN